MNVQIATATALLISWLALVRHTVRNARQSNAATAPGGDKTSIAVIYASQTGTAKDMAQRTAAALGAGRATLLAMDQAGPRQLRNYTTALFIVSTYGEGDPPDMAQAFFSQEPEPDPAAASLPGLNVGVLALGDSSYRHYCGFGLSLSQWLEQQGARFLFEPVLADQCDPAALTAWRQHVDEHFQAHVDTAHRYEDWQLIARRHMNPGSLGGACYELTLAPADARPGEWSAGDIAEIRIARLGMKREYSIASTPGEGVLRLLVRQHIDAGGKPGAGSHWLTQELQPGGVLPLHIRRNPLFHAPADSCPAIFIGNGTGIAGLRSLIQTRVEQGRHENWLIFGERQQSRDFHYGDQLRAWHAQRKIQRLDLAFSRDQTQKRYVHHLLREDATALKDWLDRGATIYVCGSKDTMARDVDQALQDILGAGYAAFVQSRRYRRDVY